MTKTKEWLLVVEADYNNKDYVTAHTNVTEKELGRFLSLLDQLPSKERGKKWVTNDRIADEFPNIATQADPRCVWFTGPYPADDVEFFDSLCPHNEYGIHTITWVWWVPSSEVRYYGN